MFTLNCKGKLFVIDRPMVMGIINATPDSFYEHSRFKGVDAILAQAEKMIAEGADMIDVGGQSTRPGSESVTIEEELRRIVTPIEAIHRRFPSAIISADTYYSRVARESAQAGANIINDISAGSIDKEMLATVAELKVPFIAMHMRGTPQNMQQQASYDDLVLEILDFFIRKKAECRKWGIKDIILDPGFGFAKTIDHNFELLKNLSVFEILHSPIMIGVSRKSSIYKTLNVGPEQALNGTTVLNTIALMSGAHILRVHDVKEAREAVKLCGMIKNNWKDVMKTPDHI